MTNADVSILSQYVISGQFSPTFQLASYSYFLTNKTTKKFFQTNVMWL